MRRGEGIGGFSSLEECFSNTSLDKNHFQSFMQYADFHVPLPSTQIQKFLVFGVGTQPPFLISVLCSLSANS